MVHLHRPCWMMLPCGIRRPHVEQRRWELLSSKPLRPSDHPIMFWHGERPKALSLAVHLCRLTNSEGNTTEVPGTSPFILFCAELWSWLISFTQFDDICDHSSCSFGSILAVHVRKKHSEHGGIVTQSIAQSAHSVTIGPQQLGEVANLRLCRGTGW